MAVTLDDELAELVDEFDLLGDWEERYRHLIDLGRTLVPLSEVERSDTNRVRGCASQVWVVQDPSQDGRLSWRGDSDAHLVRGLIAVVLRLFSQRSAAEILAFDARAGLARLGLSEALSTQRSNGLQSMIERIRRDASAG
jgi:cysteine desulfuration protein SufE